MLSETITNAVKQADQLIRTGEMSPKLWALFITQMYVAAEEAKVIERRCTPIDIENADTTNVIVFPGNEMPAYGGDVA